ncbi:response regulator [Roseateles toxinivorans]|uniref:PAS domain S-box-containing protein n=1 Tax=Roseateles toxinivorans TaxID=270368 RepID=A0A4R6QG81_9BURK|nr:response regulator [Roseateles toxinivorans]TDP62026.1 PAS domain S-box-containing protein [Roseateles toxinivorans]
MADKPRLLLVDDDTVALQVLSKTLAPYARMRFARSGTEALKAVNEELPDLLILDVNMPGLGGMDVLAALRAKPASVHLPVILVTSASDETLEATALEIGAQDFIRKPFQPELLVDRMRALLRLSALRAPNASLTTDRLRQGARILLVDDDPVAIEFMRASLAPLGATLMAAADGEQALASMHDQAPDLVLLDAEMPRLDGYAVCQAMQVDPVLAQVPVAFVSVNAEAKFETLSFAVGASDFLAKPFKPEVLLARVRKLLQLRSERDEAVSAIAAQWQELGDRRVAELVSVASDAIVSVDATGVVRLMNKAAAALFGISIERALGQQAEAVLPGWMVMGFVSEAFGLANERRRSGRGGRVFRLYRGDGAVRSVEPVVFQQGSAQHRITTVVLRDATDRIAAEQRREVHRDDVVTSAVQLALLQALASGDRSAEDLLAAAQGRVALPLNAPRLSEFDLALEIQRVQEWGLKRPVPIRLHLVLPTRTLGAMGNADNFRQGLEKLLAVAASCVTRGLDVDINCKVEEAVSLDLCLRAELADHRVVESPAWRLALMQLGAGGAITAEDAGSAHLPTTIALRLLRPRASTDVVD